MEFPAKVLVSFTDKALARLDAARTEGEDRRAFIREAVEREIKRRERKAKD